MVVLLSKQTRVGNHWQKRIKSWILYVTLCLMKMRPIIKAVYWGIHRFRSLRCIKLILISRQIRFSDLARFFSSTFCFYSDKRSYRLIQEHGGLLDKSYRRFRHLIDEGNFNLEGCGFIGLYAGLYGFLCLFCIGMFNSRYETISKKLYIDYLSNYLSYWAVDILVSSSRGLLQIQ